MLSDTRLKSQVDQLWLKFYSGGLSNPLDAIEQFSYLLFLKRLDEAENRKQRQAERLKKTYEPILKPELRWGYWTNLAADEALRFLKETIFPALRRLGETDSSFHLYMQNAECKINKPSLLIEACKLIDNMEIAQQQQDVQGDLYEYLLSKLNTAGRNGQFRTPRHIIRMMVQMIAPRPRERIGDLAAGTCGFLVNSYQYILETHTSPEILQYDEQGWPHNLIGDQLKEDELKALNSSSSLRGFDNDSGMTMLRIGSMNLMLHGIESPQFFYQDTLSKSFDDQREYDVILMNPPFKGAVDKNDLHDMLQPAGTTKSELLFVHLILRALDMGGRCAVIVPDGVLFGSSRAHVELRRKLVEENRLDGVISMPGGVFKPYAGVSTAVLFFTKGAKTENIWFYDMAADGFSLDDKRTPMAENDITEIQKCWKNRMDPEFQKARQERIADLKAAIKPLDEERLMLEGEINRLTFEQVISETVDGPIAEELERTKSNLKELQFELHPLQKEYGQLSRQFWVAKSQIKNNRYDLSASRYREPFVEQTYTPKPDMTLSRMEILEKMILDSIKNLENWIK